MIKRDNGLSAWEQNAVFWDDYMGNESNCFHREVVRPATEKLLAVKLGDYVLDIACGNGNFSSYLAEHGATVVAFDYSSKMIACAEKRRRDVLERVSFHVCDATDYHAMLSLSSGRLFDKAVSNMAIMDICDINPLFHAVYQMLSEKGVFVFTTFHPCFTMPDEDYFSPCTYKGEAIKGQPALQNYYHRSMQEIFQIAFQAGFCIDGFQEVPWPEEKRPAIMAVRLCKK